MPEPGLDYFFRNRRAVRSAKRAKALRLLQDLFGPGNFESTFVAFDPFYPFKFSKEEVAPINRKRKILVTSGYSRTRDSAKTAENCSTPLVAVAPGVNAYGPFACTRSVTRSSGNLTSQARLVGFINDTAKSTRPVSVEQGELEMFCPKLQIPGKRLGWQSSDTEGVGTTLFGAYHNRSRDYVQSNLSSTARITQVALDSYLNYERSVFDARKFGVATSLLARTLPSSREFSALREIGELKDLPRTLKDTLSGIVEVVGGRSVSLPSAFLNQKFGWDPIFSSLLKLVRLPAKITKRVNRLLERDGKPATFHNGFREDSTIGGLGQFTFDPCTNETIESTDTSVLRNTQWRMAINTMVKLPPLELPLLKEELVSQMWGLRFRPSDLYRLMPWTWLIDWFAGVGDYMDAVCAVNENPGYINWGFLTFRTEGTIRGTAVGRTTSTTSWKQDAGPTTTVTRQNPTSSTALARYVYQIRKDLGTLNNVPVSWTLSGGIPEFQLSVLAALLWQSRDVR